MNAAMGCQILPFIGQSVVTLNVVNRGHSIETPDGKDHVVNNLKSNFFVI